MKILHATTHLITDKFTLVVFGAACFISMSSNQYNSGWPGMFSTRSCKKNIDTGKKTNIY